LFRSDDQSSTLLQVHSSGGIFRGATGKQKRRRSHEGNRRSYWLSVLTIRHNVEQLHDFLQKTDSGERDIDLHVKFSVQSTIHARAKDNLIVNVIDLLPNRMV
jgi:hypothetical protein